MKIDPRPATWRRLRCVGHYYTATGERRTGYIGTYIDGGGNEHPDTKCIWNGENYRPVADWPEGFVKAEGRLCMGNW